VPCRYDTLLKPVVVVLKFWRDRIFLQYE
jgi:hypothetical protein